MNRPPLFSDNYDSPLGCLQFTFDREERLHTLTLSRAPSPAPPAGNAGGFLKKQLEEYFAGKRRTFDLNLAPAGTPFQQEVWATLVRVPFGSTVSYRDLAARAGRPEASRAVGNAVGANPIIICIPCHRVIKSSGELGGFSAGIENKILLQRLEGILLF